MNLALIKSEYLLDNKSTSNCQIKTIRPDFGKFQIQYKSKYIWHAQTNLVERLNILFILLFNDAIKIN